MTSPPDDQTTEPRYATLLDQMGAWFTARMASHDPPQIAQLRVPPPFVQPESRTP
jgi:hypothetical protein